MIAQNTLYKFSTFVLTGFLFVCLIASTAVQAQSLSEVVVFATNTQDHGDTLGLDVLFTLRDARGQPVTNAAIEGATLQMVDPQRPPVAAQRVDLADTRILITMLIDTSGSMDASLGDVKRSARTAIDSAPADALISVLRFSDARQLVLDFNGDRFRVQNAIDGIATPSGNTCLYDAAYDALDDLERFGAVQESFTRKAVILFTDGKDLRLETNAPCSVHTLNDVIARAQEYEIPVNTIGLYAQSDDISQVDLTRLAEETGGYSATGRQTELGSLFQRIFSGLNSQYMASFDTYARAGANRAFLEVKLRGRTDSVVSAPFVFTSPREFAEPTATPPPTATQPPTPIPMPTLAPTAIPFLEIRGIEPVADGFLLQISIDRPTDLAYVVLNVEEDTGLNKIKDERITVGGNPLVTYEIDSSVLKPGHEYKVIVQGVDGDDRFIMKVDEFSRSQTSTLLEKTFKYESPTPVPVVARIQGVKPDFDANLLTVSLDTTQARHLDDYLGLIVEADTGLEVDRFGPTVFPSQFDPLADRVTVPLLIPMPAKLKAQPPTNKSEEGVEYRLSLQLLTKDDQVLDLEPITFKVNPPPPATTWQKIVSAVTTSPLYLAAIIAVIASLVLWLILGRRNKRPAYRLQQSPEEYTVIGGGGGGRSISKRAKLVLQVRETPAPSDKRQLTVSRFPCTIGRSRECEFRFTGDTQISRRHAQITFIDGEFAITDLGSDNGTSVDGVALTPRTPQKLNDGQAVKIGRQTTFDIRIQYGS